MPNSQADADSPSRLSWPEPEVTLVSGLLPPVSPSQEAGAAAALRRRHLEEEAKAATLGLRGTAAPEPLIRPANQRRSTTAFKLFSLLLMLMLASFVTFAGMLFSFYERNVQPFIKGSAGSQELSSTTAPPSPDQFKADLEAASQQILRLQKQIDVLRSQQSTADQQLKQLGQQQHEGVATSLERPSDLATGLQIASVSPVGTGVVQELRLLKERNRLTLYADQAIATASSTAMAALWQSVRDPELAFVKDGAAAEIMRVQHFYDSRPGLSPDYRIPVRELLKDPAVRNETDLGVDQIIKLLLDAKLPLEVRARAAFLLGGNHEERVGTALVEAMRQDADLNVVKAAQSALQENYELLAPGLFDTTSMESAWKEHLSKASGSKVDK